MTVPLSILIPARNEMNNLPGCLAAVCGWADEVVVVDSGSTDGTAAFAERQGARVLQFQYAGGWPKKRQWALDTFPFRNGWILLLDADEVPGEGIKAEIDAALSSPAADGYYLRYEIVFLGRQLRHGATGLRKLSLFRAGKGRYEKRLEEQDASMADMEVHEHVIVDGPVGELKQPVRHCNVNSLDRFIDKHNQYSNWEARVYLKGGETTLKPRLFGTQAERRRWLKKRFLTAPGSPLFFFLFFYIGKLGFLDGRPGLIYAVLQAIQIFHIKAKIVEQGLAEARHG